MYETRKIYEIKYEVLTLISLKTVVFWDMKQCSPVEVGRCFGGIYCLHLRGRKVMYASNHQVNRTMHTINRNYTGLNGARSQEAILLVVIFARTSNSAQ